jgi:hypothetical protein
MDQTLPGKSQRRERGGAAAISKKKSMVPAESRSAAGGRSLWRFLTTESIVPAKSRGK